MPKGKAVHKQQAGAAAVPTACAKEAEYERLCAMFGAALHFAGAGTDLRAEADHVWRTCCNLDAATQNVAAMITMSALQLLNKAPEGSSASNLTALFLQRILLHAGAFDALLQQLSQQQKLEDRDLHGCIMMLMYMLGAMVERTFQAPQELYPPPDMSPAALAPKLWTPHTLIAACRALLSTSQGSLLGISKNFVFRITNPSTCEEIEVATAVGESVASRADLDAILRNKTCMDAVWKVLERHSPVGAHILSFLVTRAKSTGPGCPASLSHLLRMGAAKPLTAALTKHYKGLDEEQQQHREQGLPPQVRVL